MKHCRGHFYWDTLYLRREKSHLISSIAYRTYAFAGNADGDGDVNVAACYGIDTVHSWATVSAGSGQALRHEQLSGWRSHVDLHPRTAQTVSLDTSPVVEVHKPAPVDHGGSVGVDVSHNGLVQTSHESSVLVRPIPPPRTKRKARAPLPSAFSASLHKGL